MEIHLVDSIIYLLNKCAWKAIATYSYVIFLFYFQGLYTETSWSQPQELQVQNQNMTISGSI